MAHRRSPKDMVFLTEDIKPILAELETAKSYRISTNQLFNGDHYPGGKPLDDEGRTEAQARKAGDCFWPDQDKMKADAVIPPEIWLVGDQGVYLMHNGIKCERAPGAVEGKATLAYAEGMNPDKDEDYYENKRYCFGGDDGVAELPVEWFKEAVEKGFKKCTIRFKGNKVAFFQHN